MGTAPNQPAVVRFQGPSLVAERVDALRAQLTGALETGNNRVVLDFSEVAFIDSVFLGLMVMILKRARTAGGDVRLCSVAPSVMSIVRLMALDRVFSIHQTSYQAVDSFQQPA